jgi:hypothetical protein
VLRRAAHASSGVSAVEDCPPPRDNTSQIAGGAKKRAKATVVATGVEEDRIPSVTVRERRGPRFFDPHGLSTEGDFASADRRAAMPGSDQGASAAGIVASSRADVPVVAPTVVKTPPGIPVSSVTASVPTVRVCNAVPQGRSSEEGRSAIMQAEVVLAAAHRELESARRAILDVLDGSIADCTAAVATARRHLSIGDYGDNRDV